MNKKNNNKKFTSKYFEEELYSQVDSMSDVEMKDLLKDLTSTKYWVAISKYVQSRLMVANSTLVVIDPIKFPAETARAQGIMSGLMDLQDMTVKIKESIKRAEEKAQNKVETSESQEEDYGDKPMY